MNEANFNSEYEFSGFKEVSRDARSMYLKARLAEQSDRKRLLDLFQEGIIPKLIGMHLKMQLTKYPDSITYEIKQLKELVESAIENAHMLTNEISPHVLSRAGLRDALHELFRRYSESYGLHYYIKVEKAELDVLNENMSLLLYSLIKKMIIGTIRFRYADIIGVSLKTTDDAVEIIIQDNGSFTSDFQKIVTTGQSYEQAFLVEAADQVYSLGGKFWIDKTIGMRTVYATIPLKLKDLV